MKITLIDMQKREFVIDVNEDLLINAPVIEYKKTCYLFVGLQIEKAYRPKFVECCPPVFVG